MPIADIRGFPTTLDIQAVIDRELAKLPPGKHVAATAYVDVFGSLQVAAVARINDEWSFMGNLDVAAGKRPRGGAAVRWSR